MSLTLVLPLIPLCAAILALVLPVRLALVANAASAIAALAIACRLAVLVLGGEVVAPALGGTLRADGLAAIMSVIVTSAAAAAALPGGRLFWVDQDLRRHARRYAVLSPLLVASLLTTALADHLGLLWITLELSAVVGAFLVGLHGGRTTVEAAFKYMILGSAGLVMGLLATAFVHRAAVPVLGHGDEAMSFAHLRAAGTSLSPEAMRVALVLALAGYGLKVGLFPLHTWKPDAYAAAPAPVSGLLAGAAVAVPLAAVLRYGALASAAGLGDLTSDLFVAAGLLSVLAAMILVLRERDLRRMLAFTSVEHMGLVLLACGLEPAAVRGGLFHLLTNGTLKALAFAVIGFAVLERGSGDTQSGHGLYGRSLGLSALVLVAMAAALGFPPFGMFASELAVLGALFSAGHVALGLIVALALAAIFGVVAAGTLRLVFARSDEAGSPVRTRGDAVALSMPVLVGMGWIGVALPSGIWERIGDVARGLAP